MSKPSAADVSDAKYEHLYEQRRARDMIKAQDAMYDLEDKLLRARKDERNKVIEECAKVAEEYWRLPSDKPLPLYDAVAAAIRALKDKL